MIKYFSLLVVLGLLVLMPSPAKACAKHAKHIVKECVTVVVDHNPIRPIAILYKRNLKSAQYKHHIRRSRVHTHCHLTMQRGRSPHTIRVR
jgi:hypothetical protein